MFSDYIFNIIKMITIYHNSQCSKSREICALIKDLNRTNEPVRVIDYLKNPLTIAQLKELQQQLKRPVRDMIRDSEEAYQTLNLVAAELCDEKLYALISENPVLLQRPIVSFNGRAVIGRPPQAIQALFV